MSINGVKSVFVAVLLVAMLSGTNASVNVAMSPQKLKPEEVVAKHLESIGPAEARAKLKSHIIIGTAIGTFRLGGSGTSQGGAVLASQADKSLIAITYNSTDYPHERVGYDGTAVRIGEIRPGVRSMLGRFFSQYEMPIREGLLGGTLSTAWPLADISARNVKLKYSGTKKIGDQRAHVLTYESKNDGGLKVSLFFHEETFRHLRTEYERRMTHTMPSQPGVTQQMGDAITKLTEDFSDFQPESGVTLPHTYKLTLSIETLTHRSLQDWVFTLSKFSFNQKIDDSQFDVRTGKS